MSSLMRKITAAVVIAVVTHEVQRWVKESK